MRELLEHRRLGILNVRALIGVAAVVIMSGCGGDDASSSGATAPEPSVAPSASPLATRTDKLAIGFVNEPYLAEPALPGGLGSYRYRLAEGTLPDGLELDESTGEIRGRPARPGTARFVLEATDRLGRSVRQDYELFIDESSGVASAAKGQAPGSERSRALSRVQMQAPDLSSLLTIVASMPEGSWKRVNLNAFSDVWTPADLRPMFGLSNPTPAAIIAAWSGFAWDSKRGNLFLYGGGHANSRANDTYLWRGSTQRWERGSLPSEMVATPLGYYNAIDGVAKAPAAAHTYDNTNYLPRIDRMLVLGGAADPNGSHYLAQPTPSTVRMTGPYLFDPSLAHPDRVGGSTGSHVQRVNPYPEVIGGDMWQNRESWLNASGSSTPPSDVFSDGCTGYAEEGGKDVVYLRTVYRLYRYEISDVAKPATDRWSLVGRFYNAGSGGQAACAYDPTRKLFVSTLGQRRAQPFVIWDLSNPGPGNYDIMIAPADPAGTFMPLVADGTINLRQCGFDRDPLRDNYRLWCGDGRVWTLQPAPYGASSGWSIRREPTPAGAVPTESIGTGIIGKWKYIQNLDVFMGLLDAVQGNIWIYKPIGWVNPAGSGNLAPSVNLTAPADGARFISGASIALSADAVDGDGRVARVEFFVDDAKIGESSASPYGFIWSGSVVGRHQITARATDDQGATHTSDPVTVQIDAPAPVNQSPVITWVAPPNGSQAGVGEAVALAVAATDSDGIVVRVEYFAGVSKIGESTVAPFQFVWVSPSAGAHLLSAVATDDKGATASTTQRKLTITAADAGTSVILQRGIGNAVVVDTYLSSYHKTLNFGLENRMLDIRQTYTPLYRFAIFRSEGGPIPDGSKIKSAIFSLYKYSVYNTDYAVHRVLSDWSEVSATWVERLPGQAWTVPGGNGTGTDIAASPDATASVGWDPAWVNFDVTAAVNEMSEAAQLNRGWRLLGVGGNLSNDKMIYSSEFTGAQSLRPKLVVQYE